MADMEEVRICISAGVLYFWQLWYPAIGSLGPRRKSKVSVRRIHDATPTQNSRGCSKEFTSKVFVCFDRAEGTHNGTQSAIWGHSSSTYAPK